MRCGPDVEFSGWYKREQAATWRVLAWRVLALKVPIIIFPLTGAPPMHEASVASRSRTALPTQAHKGQSHRATGHTAAHMFVRLHACLCVHCRLPRGGRIKPLNILNPSGGRAHEPLDV